MKPLEDAFLGQRFGTILADPPWRFDSRVGKPSPEHKRLYRYATMTFEDIAALPVGSLAADRAHCYMWAPNALLLYALPILGAWGFDYKAMLVWHKVKAFPVSGQNVLFEEAPFDDGSDHRGLGFYFRNVTEPILFGVRGGLRTGDAARRQANLITARKREHPRKPDEMYAVIEACSPGPYLELFARHPRAGWSAWGEEVAA